MEFFDKWDTEPVKVKTAYKPDDYTGQEYRVRQQFERKGDDTWENASYVSDLDEMQLG